MNTNLYQEGKTFFIKFYFYTREGKTLQVIIAIKTGGVNTKLDESTTSYFIKDNFIFILN